MTATQQQTEKWKSTLDWYKQLMTVNGVAGVAIAAFLTFAGRTGSTVKPPPVAVAYVAIFMFLLSVGFAVRAMFMVINYVEPEKVREFLENLPGRFSPFYYSVAGFLFFLVAVVLHVLYLFISAV